MKRRSRILYLSAVLLAGGQAALAMGRMPGPEAVPSPAESYAIRHPYPGSGSGNLGSGAGTPGAGASNPNRGITRLGDGPGGAISGGIGPGGGYSLSTTARPETEHRTPYGGGQIHTGPGVNSSLTPPLVPE